MTNREPRKKALLVGVQLPKVTDAELHSSLDELARLVDTLGLDVIGRFTQKRPSTSGSVVLGEGKLKELAAWSGGPGVVASPVKVVKSRAKERWEAEAAAKDEAESDDESSADNPSDRSGGDASDPAKTVDADPADELESGHPSTAPTEHADVIVFDCELTPSQLKNLQSATGAELMDRTGVIIEIFSRHARTRTARLQVEIARLNYVAPRLRETGPSEGRGGGIGGKGPGESEQELDRRRIRDRLKELRTELASIQNESSVRRTRRSEENCVALVGYTNAGKSSLMRALTGSEILVADKLFATLDTTVRPLQPESIPRVLVSDTVGFIKKLPHDLVASFRSTLDEALNADLLLFVVDAADPTFREQLEVTRTVLTEIGALSGEHGRPSLLILNKSDKLTDEERLWLRREYQDAVIMSSRSRDDVLALRDKILGYFEGEMVEENLLIPFNVQGAIGDIRRHMRVLSETYGESGVTLRVRAEPTQIARLRLKFGI